MDDTDLETVSSTAAASYAHNTYHGPTKHYRPLLNSLTGAASLQLPPEQRAQPLRFTDSPQHQQQQQRRRKSSSTSNDTSSEQLYAAYDRATIYIPGDYHAHETPAAAAHCLGCCLRPDGGNANPGFSYDYGAPPPAYASPTYYRSPQHRRTPSDVSSASAGSNVNPSFRLDEDGFDEPYLGTTPTPSPYRTTPYRPTALVDSNATPPGDGGTRTRLRSSLRRANNGSGGTTPTNTTAALPGATPPDSLPSDDSSYVSAKETSSNSSVGRVRFSPETLSDRLYERDLLS